MLTLKTFELVYISENFGILNSYKHLPLILTMPSGSRKLSHIYNIYTLHTNTDTDFLAIKKAWPGSSVG